MSYCSPPVSYVDSPAQEPEVELGGGAELEDSDVLEDELVDGNPPGGTLRANCTPGEETRRAEGSEKKQVPLEYDTPVHSPSASQALMHAIKFGNRVFRYAPGESTSQ